MRKLLVGAALIGVVGFIINLPQEFPANDGTESSRAVETHAKAMTEKAHEPTAAEIAELMARYNSSPEGRAMALWNACMDSVQKAVGVDAQGHIRDIKMWNQLAHMCEQYRPH
jgi:hypothetical protein